MQSLSYLGPWQMSITDRPDPQVKETDVLIRVIAAGVCGSDVHGYTGATGRRYSGQVMGHEMVGRVVDLGLAAAGPRIGDLVTVNPLIACGVCVSCKSGAPQICDESRILGVDPSLDGSFADLVAAPMTNVVVLGDHVPEDHGALVEPLAVGYHAAVRCDSAHLEGVLIIGGGPIGQACAIAARRLGASSVLVSEPAPVRRTLLESLGFATTSPATIDDDIEDKLGGRPTAAIDAVGSSRTLTDTLQHVASGGRVVLVGMAESTITVPPYRISVKERSVVGSYCYSEQHFKETAQWVAGVHPELDLLINDRRPLADGPAAFRDLADGSAPANKLILRPAD